VSTISGGSFKLRVDKVECLDPTFPVATIHDFDLGFCWNRSLLKCSNLNPNEGWTKVEEWVGLGLVLNLIIARKHDWAPHVTSWKRCIPFKSGKNVNRWMGRKRGWIAIRIGFLSNWRMVSKSLGSDIIWGLEFGSYRILLDWSSCWRSNFGLGKQESVATLWRNDELTLFIVLRVE
jgi:hypothetical protein